MSLTVFPSTILSFNTSSSNFTHVVRKVGSVTGVTGVEDVRGVGVGMGVEMVTCGVGGSIDRRHCASVDRRCEACVKCGACAECGVGGSVKGRV